jgi:hypothetical protein
MAARRLFGRPDRGTSAPGVTLSLLYGRNETISEGGASFGGFFTAFGGLLLLLQAGCVTSPDPSEGGFLTRVNGLISGGYNQRVANQSVELDLMRAQQAASAQAAGQARVDLAHRQRAAELQASVRGQGYVRVARAVLYRGDTDSGPFGVYSYLIATQKDPESPVGQRLRAAIDVYAHEAPYCPSYFADSSRIDIFMIPVMSPRPPDAAHALCKDETVVSTFLFADYDTARASALADRAGLDGQGPYLIASLKPLSTLDPQDQRSLLIWDVSAIEPRLVRLAVDEFIASANRPDDWNKTSLRKWAIELRNWIAIGSQGWSISREAAAAAIRGPS